MSPKTRAKNSTFKTRPRNYLKLLFNLNISTFPLSTFDGNINRFHKIEITVENNRESFQFRGGELNGVLSDMDEFANFRDGIVSGPVEIVQPPTDQEIRDHGLRVETRRENDKTKNVIRFRASLSHRRGLNFRNRWTVCVVFRFSKKKEEKKKNII